MTKTIPTGRCRRTLPITFRPDPAGLLFAAERGVNVLVEWPAFRAHHIRARSMMVDWDAAWRVWCRRASPITPAAAPVQSDLFGRHAA